MLHRSVISLVALFVAMLGDSEVRAAAPPNIVVILVDDLGWADLGCYGSTFYETPNLDRLAAEGARFTQAYSACPVCSPSRASVVTGRWLQRTGVTDWIGAQGPKTWDRNTRLLPAAYSDRLPIEETTIAEALAPADYDTFYAGKWHLGPKGWLPADQGFAIDRNGNPRRQAPRDGPDGFTEETTKFLKANRDRPFLAYLASYSVHTPLRTREDLRTKYEEKRQRLGVEVRWGREGERKVRLDQDHAVYAGMIEAMDQEIGKVLASLDELGLRDTTIVVFTSDNGGVATSEGWPTANAPLRGGKGWPYEGGVRVPLLVRWPGVAKAGSVIETPVIGLDLVPTLLEAAGVTPAKGAVDGTSLVPLLRGETLPERPLFWHYPHYGNQGGAPCAAIRRGDWKLIEWYEEDRAELFDLSKDIGETTDLAATEPDRVDRLRDELHAWQKVVGAKFPTPNPRYDAAQPSGRADKRK